MRNLTISFMVHKCVIALLFFFIIISCHNTANNNVAEASSIEKDSVQVFMKKIGEDVTGRGPVAWLSYFENSPGFYMVSDGALVFNSYDSATNFINGVLLKNLKKVSLQWSNVKVDPIAFSLAGISAAFREQLTDATGKINSISGYFTALAKNTPEGWKLRNAHWSSLPGK